jgi:prepilin-type processing-associated H-X9-DG protein
MDCYSALLPYMGAKNGVTFQTDTEGKSKVFRCPSDRWLDVGLPGQNGYNIFNNITAVNGSKYFPVSYGVNADILCVSDASGTGRMGLNDNVGVVDGPPPFLSTGSGAVAGRHVGQPLQAKLGKVRHSSETLLFADCGTRPQDPGMNPASPLDFNDALYYTTNYMVNQSGMTAGDCGKLSGVMMTSWLKDRVPMDRHGGKKLPSGGYNNGKINVGFCDGHAESVLQANFKSVRVSPY